jgi:hypothetical protein
MTELKVINLGCRNGWGAEKPVEYNQHVANCGKPIFDSKGREWRDYDMTTRNLARCYDEVTCNECGIQFTVDSSD